MVSRKSGRAKTKDFEVEATYEKLQPIARLLQASFPEGHAPGQKLDAYGVAKLTMQLIDFMDDKMGKEAARLKLFLLSLLIELVGQDGMCFLAGSACTVLRIPYKLMLDFSVDGALLSVLNCCLNFRITQGWRRVEWQKTAECIEMLDRSLPELQRVQRKGFYTPPKVFFKPALPASQVKAMKKFLTTSRRCDIAKSESEPGVTHILHPDLPPSEEEEPWCRTLEVRGSEAKVHWWYYPDSYDEWLPASDVQGEAEEAEAHVGPWHVHLRWLTDTVLYNEWMNEADYEAEEEEEVEGEGGAKGGTKIGRGPRGARRQQRSGGEGEEVMVEDGEGGKRKHVAEDGDVVGEEAGNKRKRSEEVEGEDGKEDGFRFKLKRQGGGFAISKAKDVGEGSGGSEDASRPSTPMGSDGKPLEVHPDKAQKISSHPDVVKQTIVQPPTGAISGAARLDNMSQGGEEVAVPAVSAPKQDSLMEAYRIPSHAGWFHWAHIYLLEKQALPDFFSGESASKTPKLYKEYRDAMIQEYRKTPLRPLTFTQVRRYLVGDVNTLRKIFDFLNTWGLINYQATAGGDGSGNKVGKWGGTPTALIENTPSGVRMVAPPLTPTAALYEFEPPRAGRVGVAGLVTRPNAVEEGAVESAVKGSRGPAVEYHCNSCQADCSERRYHCQKQADFDLCPACFGESKFEAGLSSVDFICMDASTESDQEWSDQETLLLLEALELFGDNWTEIGEHVGTKTKAQCILHFIRLPIEDPYLEELEEGAGRRPGVLPKGTPPPPTPPLPPQVTAGGEEAMNGVVPEEGKGESDGKAVQLKEEVKEEVKMEEEEEELTPFGDASNPVMAQMAFLSALVGPKVAAAAAKAALEALVAQDPTSQSTLLSGMEVEPMETTEVQREEGGEVGAEGRKWEVAGEEKIDGEAGGKEGGDGVVGAVRVRAAAATALAAAAVKAKLLAEQEEREMQRLVASIVDTQVKKVEMKLQHFEELEEMLGKEREQLERQRQQVYAERVRLAAARSTDATLAK